MKALNGGTGLILVTILSCQHKRVLRGLNVTTNLSKPGIIFFVFGKLHLNELGQLEII